MPIRETSSGLNQALEEASRLAVQNGAGAILVLPADLPYLQAEDVRNLIELGRNPRSVVLAPAQRDGGTNALLMNPPGLIRFVFGESSYRRHSELAQPAGACVHVYRSPGTDFDLDLPEDWQEYLAAPCRAE